jgi:hypothetical protein
MLNRVPELQGKINLKSPGTPSPSRDLNLTMRDITATATEGAK